MDKNENKNVSTCNILKIFHVSQILARLQTAPTRETDSTITMKKSVWKNYPEQMPETTQQNCIEIERKVHHKISMEKRY